MQKTPTVEYFKNGIALFVVCLMAVSGWANPPSDAQLKSSEQTWYESTWQNHIVPTATDGFDRNGLLFIGGSLATVAVAQPFDYAIRDTWMDHQRMPSSVSGVFDYAGQGYFGITISLGQLIFDQENGIYHSEVLVSTFFATSILKETNQRLRPDGSDHFSMPSGHTSTTFATATALSYSYGPWIGIPAYAVAVATGASRWSDNRHWFSDTVAGALVGIFWARAAHFHNFETRAKESKRSSPFTSQITSRPEWNFTPLVSSEEVGLSASLRF